MPDIHVIFTRHYPIGRCNFEQLLAIVRQIRPEVIFEELSVKNWKLSHEQWKLPTVETNAIKFYKFEHSFLHLPVDTFEPPIAVEARIGEMWRRIFDEGTSEGSARLRKMAGDWADQCAHHGFALLNSRYNDEYMDGFEKLKVEVIEGYGEQWLHSAAAQEREVFDKREDTMLHNIYDYASKNPFGTGLFFIGSGHRTAIVRKIGDFVKTKKPGINWIVQEPRLVKMEGNL